MIQVCSQCGTRWNVRDRQRVWCPRCRGTLLAPSPETPAVDQRWSAGPRTPPRLPPGYRWIAVRPGPPPPPRRRRRPLGPTPRYLVIPRWGLQDRIEPDGAGRGSTVRQAPPAAGVHAALFATVMALGVAVLVHLMRYLLLIINRNSLLNWLVADAAALLSVLASLAAIAAVITYALLLTRWLITRRAAAFAHRGRSETRTPWALRIGCLLPPSAAMVLAITFAVILVAVRPFTQLGVDVRVRADLLSAFTRRGVVAGLCHRAGENRRQLRPAARRQSGDGGCCGCSAA